jgi:hypothetical protein
VSDPTHGRIDQDIQQAVEDMHPTSLGQRVALENTMQNRRDAGLVVLGQPPIPDHIRKVWGDMAVLCPDHEAGPTWHHREFHSPPPRHNRRIRWTLFRKALVSALRYLWGK